MQLILTPTLSLSGIDEGMMDQVKITVIATGFSEDKLRSAESRHAVDSLLVNSQRRRGRPIRCSAFMSALI